MRCVSPCAITLRVLRGNRRSLGQERMTFITVEELSAELDALRTQSAERGCAN